MAFMETCISKCIWNIRSPTEESLLPPGVHRCASVLQHEPPGTAAPESPGRGVPAVPSALVCHGPAQRGPPQPEPAERGAALRPEPR